MSGTRGKLTKVLPSPYLMANISDDEGPLLFCNRPDWADLTPLEQYENLTPIAPILYSEECKQMKLLFFFSVLVMLNVLLLSL